MFLQSLDDGIFKRHSFAEKVLSVLLCSGCTILYIMIKNIIYNFNSLHFCVGTYTENKVFLNMNRFIKQQPIYGFPSKYRSAYRPTDPLSVVFDSDHGGNQQVVNLIPGQYGLIRPWKKTDAGTIPVVPGNG